MCFCYRREEEVQQQTAQLSDQLAFANSEVARLQHALDARENTVTSVHSEHAKEMEALQKRLRELELDNSAFHV